MANTPINAIDPDGEKIVFVNGYLGFGSPTGGAKYWNGEYGNFVTSVKKIVNDYQKSILRMWNMILPLQLAKENPQDTIMRMIIFSNLQKI